MTDKLQVIGGGKMGQALVGGLVAGDRDITVVEVSTDQQAVLTDMFPTATVTDTPVDGVDTILAVKPNVVVDVCRRSHRLG